MVIIVVNNSRWSFGIIISIILFSKIISYCLSEYYVITMLFFIGLIIGGVPTIISKVKRNDYYIVFIRIDVI